MAQAQHIGSPHTPTNQPTRGGGGDTAPDSDVSISRTSKKIQNELQAEVAQLRQALVASVAVVKQISGTATTPEATAAATAHAVQTMEQVIEVVNFKCPQMI